MIILKQQADRLVAVMSIAQATSPVTITTSTRKISPITYDAESAFVSLSDNTPTDIVQPIVNGEVQKAVEYISIYNADSVAHVITIAIVNGGTSYPIRAFLLASNESAEYNDREGWRAFSSNGAMKNVYQNGVSPIGTNVNMVVLSSPVVNNNAVANTMQDVTGLQFAGVAGQRYRFKFVVNYSAQALTTGSRWSVNGTGSPTDLNYDSDYSLTTTTRTINTGQSAYDLPAAANASSASLTANIAIVEGFITPSANGTIILRFASEVAGSAITVKAGSYLEYQQL